MNSKYLAYGANPLKGIKYVKANNDCLKLNTCVAAGPLQLADGRKFICQRNGMTREDAHLHCRY